LRLRFLNAGIRHENAPLLYFGAKTLLPLVMMFLVYSLMLAQGTTDSLQLLLYPLVTGLVACYLPNLVLRWMAARRKREIFENFPMPPTSCWSAWRPAWDWMQRWAR
jgi:tight adherence protein C